MNGLEDLLGEMGLTAHGPIVGGLGDRVDFAAAPPQSSRAGFRAGFDDRLRCFAVEAAKIMAASVMPGPYKLDH